MSKMLIKRVISATLGIAFLALMLYLGGWFFKVSVLMMSLIAMYEFYRAFIKKGYKPIVWLGYVFIVLLFYFNFISLKDNSMLLASLIVIVGMAIPIFNSSRNIIDICITIFAAFYPGIMVFFMLPLGSLANPYGMKILLLAFIATWSTDTFAYIFGSKLGKRKLCPSVSPNKTIEGSLGGLLGSILMATLFGIFVDFIFESGIALYHFMIIGLLGGVVSQLGDLCASSIKRFCSVKDFGKLLPGHGGLLDRFDSLLFTMPTVYLYYLIFLAQ